MKEYIIFGAGKSGVEALFYYGYRNVAFFCDNQKSGKVKGIPVIDFQEMARVCHKYEIVLAVSKLSYRKEMKRQLEERGIQYVEFGTFNWRLHEDNFMGEYQFENRSRGKNKLLMILAGYKEFLWDSVFKRVKAYLPVDVDVCVMTAGYRNAGLETLCEQEGWSYLYTDKNQVSQIQNITVGLHPAAEWIYKLDEDIFITPGLFEELMDTYLFVENEKKYGVGIVAPLMPVNGYGYRRVLENMELLSEYEERFGGAVSGIGDIHTNTEAALYMWEKTLPLNKFAGKMKLGGVKYTICPYRFSIGCFLMRKDAWEAMGGFEASREGVLGVDEKRLCQWCMDTARPVVVAERAVAGHFSYGMQTEGMKKLYTERRGDFDC